MVVLALLAVAQETADFTDQLDHGGAVTSVAVSPDGKTIATAGETDSVRLWRDGKAWRSLGIGEQGCAGLAFLPGGKRLGVDGASHRFAVFEVEDGSVVRMIGDRNANTGRDMAASPIADVFVFTNSTGDVWSWSLNGDSTMIWDPPGGESAGPMCFSADGRTLLVGCDSGAVRRFEFDAAREIDRLDAHKGTVLAMAAGDRVFASGGRDMKIMLWRTDGSPAATLEGHKRVLTALAFSPDGRFLASADTGRSFHLWDLASGQHMLRFAAHDRRINALAWTPDGRLVSGSADGTALVWGLDRAIGEWTSDERDLETLWDRMATAHPLGQHRAVRQMAATEGAAAFVGERVKPVSDERIRALIRQLDAEEPDRRDAAQAELLVADAEAELETALAETKSPEVRARLEVLLVATAGPVVRSDVALRRLRAIHVLERIGTDEARAMLETIGTREAKAAAARIAKR